MTLLHLDLPSEPVSVAKARDALDGLAQHLGPQLIPDLRLLVSEVVTNAVRHADAAPGARVVLIAEERPDCVRVEIYDDGGGFDPPVDLTPRPEATSGWGLFFVQKLSRRWGTEPPPGAHVWFEL